MLYQEQNTVISIVSCKKPRMDDIPNICDGNDKMSKSVWTSTLPDKKPLLHLLSEQNIVCPAESKLSERRKCPQDRRSFQCFYQFCFVSEIANEL